MSRRLVTCAADFIARPSDLILSLPKDEVRARRTKGTA